MSLSVGLDVQLALAQEEVPPALRITGVDTSQFPETMISLYGENLGTSLDKLELTLREDKQLRSIAASGFTEIGIQTALVLDASSNIRNPGLVDGRARYEEFQLAVDTLLEKNLLSAETDWLAAFATGATSDDFHIIADWTQDHGALRNEVLLYTPEGDIARTPLFDLIEYTLSHFRDTHAPSNILKSIVVFSDGFDATSDLDQTDVIRQAEEMNVRIYPVLVGPPDEERQSSMERIAKLTNGQLVLLDDVAALDPLWATLQQQQQQLVVRYRAGKAQPREVEITAQAPGIPPLTRRADYPVVRVEPVRVTVVGPADGFTIERKAAAFDTPLADITPRALPIQLNYLWPDERPRNLQRVEFTINDDTRVLDSEPFDKFLFPIEELPTGRYTLRINAVDELGIEGKSAPLPVEIDVVIPPPPTPTSLPPTDTPAPSATAVPTIIPTPMPTPIVRPVSDATMRSVLLLLAALLLAAWVLVRSWRRLDETSTAPDSTLAQNGVASQDDWSDVAQPYTMMDDATEIPAEPPFNPLPAAHLVSIEKFEHLPSQIVLHVGSVVRIGRRADLCDVVLDDKRISRAHAIIAHREDGFRIQDDGSKGGTYVNQRRLSVSDDRVLKTGDIINFHAIAYRFELIEDEHTEIPDDLFASTELLSAYAMGHVAESK